MYKKKILIYADSRGQHKPAGQSYDIFAERLAKDHRLEVDMFLCPMKWTTTLDFLDQFSIQLLSKYDYIILYTGIVEWSPRPIDNALNGLYNNQNTENLSNAGLNTRDYSKKIVNNKKKIFDKVFGENAMSHHFSKDFGVLYENQATMNMYSLDMASESLIPKLLDIPNLIFINSNKFVKGWEGDFKRGRPENIRMTEKYSKLFAQKLTSQNINVIDLMDWSDEEVMRYTCDNLHLTQKGSDLIYDAIMKVVEIEPAKKSNNIDFDVPEYTFTQFKNIESFQQKEKKEKVLASVGSSYKFLGTLIIGVRYKPGDHQRLSNLKFLLKWIDYYYGDMFDVLIAEQDAAKMLPLEILELKEYVRYCFMYNPEDYNRGWGYNVAVKYFCHDSTVVALMDTDVLTGPNFVADVRDCHRKLKVASPYINIYYSDEEEASLVKKTMNLSSLTNTSHIKNPVTVAGGIVIWNKSAYLAIKGFEQYRGYSCEDRAMDVTIFNHFSKDQIRISPHTYLHLHHDTDKSARANFKEIYSHLTQNYQCTYDKSLGPNEFIHKNCNHSDILKTSSMIIDRSEDFGNIDLYKGHTLLTINGQKPKNHYKVSKNIIFPPEFSSLDNYQIKEIYKQAPAPDSEEIGIFYNRFKGHRCFIIGNGPSLNNHDLSLLTNEYTFGVNSFYYKTRETGFTPTFYVVEDSSVMKENIEEIRKYDAPFKFFPTVYKNLHKKLPNVYFFNMNRSFYEKSSPYYAVPRFSTDASKVLYCGQSVTYINLQLAFFMGFTEVYLIGMDFSYIIPESHTRTGDVLLSDTDDPNHFHKDYFGKGKTWKDPKLDRVLMNYRMADLAYSSVGRKISNATKGGKLEVFDRVSYNELLNSPTIKNENTYTSTNSKNNQTISEANMLFKSGQFKEALELNLNLYNKRSLKMYINNAIYIAKKIGAKNTISSYQDLRSFCQSLEE